MNEDPKMLIIGHVWPEPDSSAAGTRMMQLISMLINHGWRVLFATAAADSEHKADLRAQGVESVAIEMNNSAFDEFLKGLDPEVVLFDRFMTEEQFGWRVAEHCPDALRILDTEDLHCLRRSRQKALKHSRSFENQELKEEEVAIREVASIYRSDMTLIISEVEMKLLRSSFKVDASLLFYLPFLFESIQHRHPDEGKTYEERKHFVTIGNFRHAPNMDAVKYLKTTIWPLIRDKMPEAQLHVYGSYPTQQARELHRPDRGFHIRGRAESAEQVVGKARVLLAPLRFGAGLKGKLLEAMQCGTPSVTTSIGSEGINGHQDWPGVITDDPEAFAAASVKLHEDRASWMRAGQQGAEIINTRFLREQYEAALIQRIDDLRETLSKHRRNNFIGRMLLHHTMRSTEYMSRWIEEKNK